MKKTLISLTLVSILAACTTSPTGRSQLLLVSEQSAIASSKQAYSELMTPLAKEGKVNTDPKIKARVDRIAERIVAQAVAFRPETKNWEWEMQVIDDDETANAWAMAGGKMAVYTGLIKQVNTTDDELAQVIGHEISHALAKHSAEKMSMAMASQLGVVTVGIATNSKGTTMAGVSLAAALAITLPNSRTMETEADRLGVELAAKAGYDPRAAVTLWQKMGKLGNGAPPQFLSTHPNPSTRIQTLSRLAPEMMPYFQAKGERPTFPVK